MLLGRTAECAILDRLLASVRDGRSRVLVVRGEPGVGKTALLDYLSASAADCRIVRAAGIESELELPFAGLHQLCAPLLDRLEHLPDPQRTALGTAFGLEIGEPPDRFLVALAVLSLLAEVAEEGALVCLVDDAQWLDRVSAQTLAFVARRLLAERVALVFAVREGTEHEFDDFSSLFVPGLDRTDARALLDSALTGAFDDRVRERIVAETHGNPLALLELTHGRTASELAGGFAVSDAMPLTSRIEQGFVARLGSLSKDARRLMLTAAADPTGEPILLWRALERLAISQHAADEAEDSGLLELGAQVTFRHPLVRSAVYRSASRQERTQVHEALAGATDADADPDRRAWHRAAAAGGPDEDVAAELERSAARAQARGGLAAAAAFLQRAVFLTADPARLPERALAAALANLHAGAFETALQLVSAAEAGPLDELQRARAELLRGQIAFAASAGREAPPLLLAAAKRLEPIDARLARETYLDAWGAALFAGRLASGAGLHEISEAAKAAPSALAPAPADLLLDGLATLVNDGRAAAIETLRDASNAFAADEHPAEENFR